MPPKFQISTPMNTEGSNSSSSLDMTKLTSSLEATEPVKALLHQGSASDSLTGVKRPCLVGQGSSQSPHEVEISENSSSSLVGQTKPPKWSRSLDSEMDPKKLKRVLANRASAHKSRLKKLEYVEKLEREVLVQQAKISALAPEVAFKRAQRNMLQQENDEMRRKMEILEKKKADKDAEFTKLKHERDVLALTRALQEEGL
ncbi:hypothetical protein CCACVL1_10496 [Corchorus capsularis]|uniref:BZIP domain-containing protein n=1 Tax=Corchorus capsularis TaxID=210143 RepID=A0A1R3IQZ2_COCAP|nr:hypothetical protein CCACVL1_10496 [Corchorus capsularis]